MLAPHNACRSKSAGIAKLRQARRWVIGCARELHADYVHIGIVLDVIEAVIRRLNNRHYVDPQMLHGLVRFFRDFVQDCHRQKVETLVFPLVAARGTFAERETMELLGSQYQSGGALLEEMSLLLMRLPERRDALDTITSVTGRYIEHNRRHFATERVLLQDFLGRALTEAEDEDLVADFARLERDRIGPTAREWYTQMILDYRNIVSTWSNPLPKFCAPCGPEARR
jgi:hemerythrin-like domain-containing protein